MKTTFKCSTVRHCHSGLTGANVQTMMQFMWQRPSLSFSDWTFCRLLRPISPRRLDGWKFALSSLALMCKPQLIGLPHGSALLDAGGGRKSALQCQDKAGCLGCGLPARGIRYMHTQTAPPPPTYLHTRNEQLFLFRGKSRVEG